jgi:hypothetical protein
VRVRAALVVVCLLVSVAAWGQTPQCGTRYTPEAWNRLSEEMRVIVCRVEAKMATFDTRMEEIKAYDQPQPDPPIRSQKMLVAGIISIIAGSVMALPQGTTYSIFGDDVCVNTYSIDAGGCKSPALAIGMGLIGGGVMLAYAGTRPITVSPMISPTVKGASARISWGGSNGRR